MSAVNAHAFGFEGASPKNSVAAAFVFGLMISFIQRYMQLGCLAFAEIIHVSDQPVEPSFGSTTPTGAFSVRRELAMTCHVVPTVVDPALNAAICFV